MKKVAVINDHTMQIVYALRGHEDDFKTTVVADDIIQAGVHGEDAIAIFGKHRHFLNSNHYSFICEMEDIK